MQMSWAKETDLPGMREMWERCFGADDAYLKLYFNCRYRPEEVLVCREGDRPAAMLSLLPCVYRRSGVDYPCSYVFAVATNPDDQGKGYSTKLLQFAAEEMAAQKVSLLVLAPAESSLFSFYRARGYEDWFFQREEVFSPVERPETAPVALREFSREAHSLEEYARRREQFLHQEGKRFSDGTDAILWDADGMRFPAGESSLYGGGLYSLEWGGGSCLCCLYRSEEMVLAKELLCCPEEEQDAIRALQSLFPDLKLGLRLPAWNGEGSCVGMARWLIDPPSSTGKAYLSFSLD